MGVCDVPWRFIAVLLVGPYSSPLRTRHRAEHLAELFLPHAGAESALQIPLLAIVDSRERFRYSVGLLDNSLVYNQLFL